ncbi:carbohydrate ABC transporter permease [Rubellicoccus peritrichatus]|uniref:ABC transporter permease subunit n=1 Tax=Rubellicoccus peritrichatus TaxID=3080537 RepID=A0AAQ3L7W6_9BACT|nr:ABC transporter permease subunit [Puniceicoccus sp. CR14]WOO41279.1 ABC transporter permease subunit [Puniceicoccus sp. CR14]
MASSRSSQSDLSSAELSKFKRHQFWQKSRLWLTLYMLCLPTIGSLLLFSYYPKVDVVIMSFFRWVPSQIREFIGFNNFKEAFADPQFWQSFKLVGILLVANLAKLWPGILAAIALHRLASQKLRYLFQVCFVVPMIIPAMVWLLIWKSFYDPDFGLLNRVLKVTGGMELLDGMDTFMPKVASLLSPVFNGFINPVFGGVGGLILLGFFIFGSAGRKELEKSRWGDYGLIIASSLIVPVFAWTGLIQTIPGIVVMLIAIIVAMVLLNKRLGSSWIAWPFLILAGITVFWGELVRLPIGIIAAFAIYEIIRSKRDFYTGKPILMTISLTVITVGSLLILFGNIWTEPLEQFHGGNPAWLGNKDLVIPALIFWGFPWVGTVGVLIYLSGLQNIPQDVYEAAELDGVSPLGMIWHVELPLIMTQVRINLIFLTINTLVAYETFLILLGPDGGPGNKGMVPGLYMFSSAFSEGRFGYACALGMVLFIIILLLTIVYQKYVRVEK